MNALLLSLSRFVCRIRACTIIFLLFSVTAGAATRTAIQNGDWYSTATWGGNPVPVDNDDVIIPSGITVTISGPIENPWGDNGVGFNTALHYVGVSGKLILSNTSSSAFFKFYKPVNFLVKNGGEVNCTTAQGLFWNGTLMGIENNSSLLMYIESGGKFTIGTAPMNFFGHDELSINTSMPISSGTQTSSFMLTPIIDDLSNGGVQITTTGLTAPMPAVSAGPTITSAVAGSGHLKAGNVITITLIYSANVTVTGSPYLPITLNTGTVHAVYGDGSGTNQLAFRYTLTGTDEDDDGIVVGNSVTLNGGTIKDDIGNNAATSFTAPSGSNFFVDNIAPTVLSLTAKDATTTNATTVRYDLTFSENIFNSDLDATDFTLTKTGGVTGAITSITNSNGGVSNASTFIVTVTGVSGNGTLKLDFNSSGTGVNDQAHNPLSGGVSGDTYTIDNTPPTVTIKTGSDNPTNSTIVTFTAVFQGAVTGVDKNDFNLTTVTGSFSSTFINLDALSPSSYQLTYQVSGTGTLRLDLKGAGTGITDLAGNAPAAYTGGDVLSVDQSAPTIVSGAGSTFLTNNPKGGNKAKVGDVLTFKMEFNEAVQTPTVTIAGHPVTVSNVSDNINWTCSYQMASGDTEGTVPFTIDFTDLAGNDGAQLTNVNTGVTIAFDKTKPVVAAPVLAAASDSGTPGDNITNVTTPIFTGTTENSATVKIYDTDGSTVLGTIAASSTDGSWSITSSALTPGDHTITAIATDLVGNVSDVSPGLAVTINTTIPTATITSVPAVEETSTSFDINYTGATGNPDLYSVDVAATNQMPGFSPVSNFSLHANTINVTIPTSNAGTYDFILSVRNQAAGNSSADIPFSLTVNAPPPPPTVTLTGTLNAFSSCIGSVSAEQSFKVGGTNLTGDITVAAPSGFEISKATGTDFGTQLTYAQSGGIVGVQDVFVRIAADATGTPAGDIVISSNGVTDQDETVTGTVNDLPTITVGAVADVPQAATTFTLPYSGVPAGSYIYYITRGTRRMPDFSEVNGFTLVPTVSVNLPPSPATGTYDFNLYIVNTVTGCSSAVQPFTLTVVFSNDATLSSLTTSEGSFNPTFDPAVTTGYNMTVPNATATIKITPTASNADVSDLIARVNGGAPVAVFTGSESAPLALNVGDNTITIEITAQDGTTVKTYSLTVNRAGSSEARLATLTLDPKTPMVQRHGTNYVDYTANVTSQTTSVTVTPVTIDNGATVTVNGAAVVSGTASAPITLNNDTTAIATTVTAADGVTKKTYRLVVRHNPSGVATLGSLALNPARTLTKVSGDDYADYTTTVFMPLNTVNITAMASDNLATITINGVATTSGVQSGPITLNSDTTAIAVTVTAPNGTTKKTYRVVVTRVASNDARLITLAIDPKTPLVKVSGDNYADYTTNVASQTTSIQVIPTTVESNSTVTVNGVPTVSGTASAPITLNADTTAIAVTVTAQDGVVKKTYRIMVSKQPLVLAILSSLTVSPGSPLVSVAGSDYRDYIANVTSQTTSVTVTPVAADNLATVTVNGTANTSGTASAPITLNIDTTAIAVTVTAPDGVTKNTYRVVVVRTPSAVAQLTSFTIKPQTPLIKVTGTDYQDYTTTVPNSTSSIKITAVTRDNTATITVNGIAVASGTETGAITLNADTTTIATTVTAQDGITKNSYVILVTRQPLPPAYMAYNPVNEIPVESEQVTVHQNVSPNSDGQGDAMIIEGITKYPDNKLQIMSRTGNLVYEVKGYDNAGKVFDGHASNGKLQQAGTYFYSLEYKVGNETKRKTGYIVLKY